MSILKKSFLLAFLVLVADQILKIWVKTHMVTGSMGEIPVIGDWFIIHFTENPGMALGMKFGGPMGKVFLSLFRIVAVIVIGGYIVWLSRKGAHKGLILCMGLIMAGALGNIIDSAFYGMIFGESTPYKVAEMFPEGGGYSSFLHGSVVDMFYFPVLKGHYPDWFPIWKGREFLFFRPVFNIADSAITVGVFTLMIFHKRFFKEPPGAKS